MILPNFVIVGAAKAGTTSLYYYLKQHPEIGFPVLKEPKYFSSKNLNFPHRGVGDRTVDKYAIRRFDTYVKLFENLTSFKCIGEASPDYLYYYDYTIEEIRSTLGDIPIVIIIRDPVARAFSAYSYLVRDSRESCSFREGLDAEEMRLKNNWDFIWGYKKCGMYYNPIRAFLDAFTKVRVILFDDLKEGTLETIRDLYRFLEVDPDFIPDVKIEYNPSGVPSNIISKFILSRGNRVSTFVRETLKKYVSRSVLEHMAKRSLSRLKISEEDRDFLRGCFRDDITKLESLLNIDLSRWKR